MVNMTELKVFRVGFTADKEEGNSIVGTRRVVAESKSVAILSLPYLRKQMEKELRLKEEEHELHFGTLEEEAGTVFVPFPK